MLKFIFVFCYYLMRGTDYHRKDRQRSRSRSPRDKQQVRVDKPLQPRFKLEQTRTLMLQGVGDAAGQAERMFTDLSISIGTSIPDEVQTQGDKLFLRYPSVQAAISVMEHVKGQATLAGRKFKVQYFPVRKVDVNVAYDWYCEKCDYKNFARRNRCYRCEAEKVPTCRLSYSTQPALRPFREETAQNCSLMLRGQVLTEVEESTLLQIFEAFAPVKDIRQIKNKLSGGFKDFAFIQFYSPQETAVAFRQANQLQFRINGQKITVMYSRNKSDDDYVKPLPYQTSKRQRKGGRDKSQQEENYYHRQRQRQIQEQKARPTITMQQLKEKRQQQMKKNQQPPKEMSQQQAKRKQAELLAKQWQRQMKVQATLYVCPACSRKFQSLDQMRTHEKLSQLHRFQMEKLQGASLAL